MSEIKNIIKLERNLKTDGWGERVFLKLRNRREMRNKETILSMDHV